MSTARKRGRGYEIRVFLGLDIHARRMEKSKTWVPEPGMTEKQIEKELERQKVLFEEQVKQGISPDTSIRFKDFADRWLVEYAKDHLAPKTFSRYVDYLKRINEGIGHIRLKELTPFHLNAFYKNLAEDGISKRMVKLPNGKLVNGKLSPKTVHEHHVVISKILNTAVKWAVLDKNVALQADPPKVPYREINYLDETETRRMIFLLNNEPIQYRAMILLLLFTGMRRGELCGLEWKDIDFDTRKLKIVRSSQYLGGGQMFTKEPKTKAGIREISLSENTCCILQEYRLWQSRERLKLGELWKDTDRLFTQWNGIPIHPDTITGWFSRFIKRNNFPHVTLHSLRHTNATLLIAEGTDVCTVSKRLGHANTATTLNIYTHALHSKDEEAAQKLDEVLAI